MRTTRCVLHRASLLLSFLCLACIVSSALAGPAGDWERMKAMTPRGYVSGFARTPPVIDGRLDDAVWKAAPWTDDFVDIEGDRKPRPRFRTRAKMAWDQNYFYVAAEMEEPHVWATLTTHDSVIFHDNDFEVFIDPNGDNHEYYELELNALNTTWDLFLPRPYKDGGKADDSWEIPGLKSAVHVKGTLNNPADQDAGWSVEIAIPWKVLGKHARRSAPPNHGDQWRVNFSRVEWRHEVVDGKYRRIPKTPEDNWVWSPQGIIDMHRPERWGFVQFSKEAPGATAFTPDGHLRNRDLLMEIYHRQKSFHKQHGKWAGSLKEFDFTPPEGFAPRLELRLTDDGFRATLDVARAGDPPRRWHVRQDSRLWMSSAGKEVESALDRAGDNRVQLQQALDQAPEAHREAMEFLIANMPTRDLRDLSAEFLLDDVRLAYQAWDESPWKKSVPKEIFFNNVLPYANINEARDHWRPDFHKQFKPLVENAKSPAEAAVILNQKIFPLLKVRYSTKRNRADQGPSESIKTGLASCTGLSILLIDACRSVGVPARFAGTPLWSDNSGNHSWVEIWDDGWHFTGAAEPSGNELNKAWFVGRAAKAQRDHPLHAVYAVSYQRTPQAFPLPWDRSIDYVFAVNVTDRYTRASKSLPEGHIEVLFRAVDGKTGDRCSVPLKIFGPTGQVVFEGKTKGEQFDANDHLAAALRSGEEFKVEVRRDGQVVFQTFRAEKRNAPVTLRFDAPKEAKGNLDGAASRAAVESLKIYLAVDASKRKPLADEPFGSVPLTRDDANRAAELLRLEHAARIRVTRAAELEKRELTAGDLKMPFYYKTYGAKPDGGRSMYISLHGGGGTTKQVNDGQWENQKRLYTLEEGVYVAPRAPTNTWKLWHEDHIDGLFDRLIENMMVWEDVNPNRVYLMGYSAGGDGVFQLAPRMADRWAAAAMMAGHPNETSPLGLRNLAFTMHVGGRDSAYSRNKVARDWQQKLAELQKADAGGYVHWVKIYEDKGHWLDREDAAAIPWMAKHRRNLLPTRVVWKQDDVVHRRFYWLAVEAGQAKPRAEIIAERDGQNLKIQSSDVKRVLIRLNDQMLDLDQPVRITMNDKVVFEGVARRTAAMLAKSLAERGDPLGLFAAEVGIEPPAPPP